jgi:choline dehydrogenase-like flavoprotein
VFTDGRTLDDGAILDCDVCIVGTGAAGVTAAIALRDAGLRLCVLEAGGLRPDENSRADIDVQSSALPIGPRSRERYFGGTTNTWWGKMATLDGIDLTPRRWIPLSGWPLDRTELTRYYRRACRLLRMPDLTTASGDRWRGRRELLDSGDLSTVVFFWWRHAPNFGEMYRRAVLGRPDVTTVLHANVTELELDEAGGRVASVLATGAPGRSFRVRPRLVILAAGGIENPRLLLASRSRLPAGVGNGHDQVGRYFMDHPRGQCGVVEAREDSGRRLSMAYWTGRRLGSGRIRLGVRLSDRAQERLNTLNSYVLLDPVHAGSESRGTEALREVYRRGPRSALDPRIVRDLATGIPGLLRYASFRALGIGPLTGIRVQNFMEQAPRAGDRVELSNRRDRFGVPLPRVRWTIDELDRHSVRELHRILARDLERRGIGLLRSPALEGEGDWPISGDAAHHMGTTRMGSDPRTSVVDPDCRVHDVDNLFVGGSSVFPTGGYANPTLTIVALALRLADRVRRPLGP